MNITRLVKGEIFFDEFNTSELNENWTLVPNDSLRYSLVERSGYLRLFHGIPDVMLLMDEPDEYIIDLKNDYVPLNGLVQAGLVVFKELGDNLEILEFYDTEKEESSIYEYIRLIKRGNQYTVYGKNTGWESWELVGSVDFQSAGRVGIICKGPSVEGFTNFDVEYFRCYKNQYVQIVNIPVGYRVDLYREDNGLAIGSKTVLNPYNGAVIFLDFVPNTRLFFKIVNENGDLIHRSSAFDMCGGDIYFYGASLKVFVNGLSMAFDEEYFLGYYQSSKIDFTVTLQNTHDVAFNDVTLEAVPYKDDIIGYTVVNFCHTQEGTYTPSITVSEIPASSSVTVYGRIVRSNDINASDVIPFKFNLKVTNS